MPSVPRACEVKEFISRQLSHCDPLIGDAEFGRRTRVPLSHCSRSITAGNERRHEA